MRLPFRRAPACPATGSWRAGAVCGRGAGCCGSSWRGAGPSRSGPSGGSAGWRRRRAFGWRWPSRARAADPLNRWAILTCVSRLLAVKDRNCHHGKGCGQIGPNHSDSFLSVYMAAFIYCVHFIGLVVKWKVHNGGLVLKNLIYIFKSSFNTTKKRSNFCPFLLVIVEWFW